MTSLETSLEVADAWFRAVLDGDGRGAWRRTDPAYRRVLVRRWANQAGRSLSEPEESVLVEEGHDDHVWGAYAKAQRRGFLNALPEAAKKDQWGWVARPRLVAPDYELVLLVDRDELADRAKLPGADDSQAPAVTLVSAVHFYMRYTGSEWLLAGLHEEPAEFATSS